MLLLFPFLLLYSYSSFVSEFIPLFAVGWGLSVGSCPVEDDDDGASESLFLFLVSCVFLSHATVMWAPTESQ